MLHLAKIPGQSPFFMRSSLPPAEHICENFSMQISTSLPLLILQYCFWIILNAAFILDSNQSAFLPPFIPFLSQLLSYSGNFWVWSLILLFLLAHAYFFSTGAIWFKVYLLHQNAAGIRLYTHAHSLVKLGGKVLCQSVLFMQKNNVSHQQHRRTGT